MNNKKILLIILDGWGIGKKNLNNPIFKAKTPNYDLFIKKYPNSQLKASGQAVGLPAKTMGNSEVGHLNLGAGRLIKQDLLKINESCKDNSLFKNKYLLEAISKAKIKNRSLHLIGLISDAGVHSHVNHLYKICELAKKNNLKKVYIHAIGDGRDTDPKSGLSYINKLEKRIKSSNIKIATLIGRYYAMDRDKNWQRTKIAYDMLVKAKGEKVVNLQKSIKESYSQGITDEFINPKILVNKRGKEISKIEKDDVVICFNFRTERLRQLTVALTQKNILKIKSKKLSLNYYTLTPYDDYKNVKTIFNHEKIVNTLGELISKYKLSQLRIAETEKYAHVTSFFSGLRKEAFKKEDRCLINSPKVATYDLKPEMSAYFIVQSFIKLINKKNYNFVCMNFANCDMVGHTGNFKAIVKAVEVVDSCLNKVVKEAQKNNYQIIITADHGNAEQAINLNGSFNTNHSINPVPCILISENYKTIKNGSLANVAPTILEMMAIKKPKEMSSSSLL